MNLNECVLLFSYCSSASKWQPVSEQEKLLYFENNIYMCTCINGIEQIEQNILLAKSKCFWWWHVTINVTISDVHCLSSLSFSKHSVSELGSVSIIRCRKGKVPTQLGLLEGPIINHFSWVFSNITTEMGLTSIISCKGRKVPTQLEPILRC
jgi:hypothetical protein